MPDLVIIADDLSGAADCGIVCAEAGLDTVVMLGHRHDEPDVAVLAIDADTRSGTRAEAAAETYRLVKAHAPAGRTLFRKIDSTLRGHMAAELAATLAARRESGRALILLAPAFPATGRTFATTQSHWFGIADGKVIEHWANRDDLGTATQLGWTPPSPLYLARMLVATRRAKRAADR